MIGIPSSWSFITPISTNRKFYGLNTAKSGWNQLKLALRHDFSLDLDQQNQAFKQEHSGMWASVRSNVLRLVDPWFAFIETIVRVHRHLRQVSVILTHVMPVQYKLANLPSVDHRGSILYADMCAKDIHHWEFLTFAREPTMQGHLWFLWVNQIISWTLLLRLNPRVSPVSMATNHHQGDFVSV